MMRRKGHALLMAVLLVLTLGLAAPAQADPADPVPIKGTLSGTETIYPAGTWDLYGYFVDPGPQTEFDIDGDGVTDYTCSEPAHELVVGTLTGNVAHLGEVTREMSYCAFWDGEGQYRMFDFSQVLFAANGDTLEMGQGPSDLEEVDGWVVGTVDTPIIGGTGRFAGASGTLSEAVRSTAPWWPDGFPYTSEGSDPWVKDVYLTYTHDSDISYDASNLAAK
jgi:hypothetical protein